MKNKKEILMYIVFGVLTTLVGWGTYILFEKALKSVFWANLLSWICAVAFAYVTNKLWVFESKSWNAKILLKEVSTFLASRGITGVLESFLFRCLQNGDLTIRFLPLQKART